MQFSYTVAANTFKAATKSEANALATAYANAQAPLVKFCCAPDDVYACCNTSIWETFLVSAGTGPFVWTINSAFPSGLQIAFLDSGRTMILYGTIATGGNYALSFTITDQSSNQNIRVNFTLHVFGITDTSLPAGQVGVPYSHQLSSTGGSGSYHYAVTSGTLTPGLTLNTSGLIAGIPTTAGTETFTISLSDQAEDNPIEGVMVATELPDYCQATGAWNEHIYAIHNYATLFAAPADPPATVPCTGTIWDGNFGSLYTYNPGARYVLCFPNHKSGTAALWFYNAPSPYWILAVWCDTTGASPPVPETLLWSGVLVGVSGAGVYARTGGTMTDLTMSVDLIS